MRRLASDALSSGDIAALRELFEAAWSGEPEGFTAQDWEHAVGGVHFILYEEERVIAHASVVPRELHADGHALRTGYVEAVATSPPHQRRGHGSALLREVTDYIDGAFELGALDTGSPGYYRRLGWVVWEGPTFVRTNAGPVRTEEEDGSVLVRLTPRSPKLDLRGPISCDWRPGDAW